MSSEEASERGLAGKRPHERSTAISLSICIPTHHGRCAVLQQALESIAAQVLPELKARIEIVVSDNASRDGTEAMLAELISRHPDVEIIYARNERDLRLANIMRSVERASGEWCWLFGSDDLMAQGALAAVTAAIAAHRDASGIAVARTNFDHEMHRRVGADPPETSPQWHETTVIRGFAEIENALAFQHGFLGTNVVQRRLWLEAAGDVAPRALERHPTWPQLLVFAEMARRRPVWVWLPTVLVLVRSGRPYLVEGDGEEPNFARMHVVLVDGLRRAWSEIAADDRVLRGALIERTLQVAGSRQAVENIKLSHAHGFAWDLRLAWTFLRAFSRYPRFWREVAPLLAVPSPVYRTARARRRARGGPMPVLATEECSVRLHAELPTRWWAREMPRIRCRLKNTGPLTLRTAGEHPIHVGGRWFEADGTLLLETVRDPLPRPLAPNEEVEVLVRTHTPWEPGNYRLELDCVQENVRWFGEADRTNALSVEVDVELPGANAQRPS